MSPLKKISWCWFPEFPVRGKEKCSCTARAERRRAEEHFVLCVAALSLYLGLTGVLNKNDMKESGEFQMSHGDFTNLCSLVVSEKPQPDPNSVSQLASRSLWLWSWLQSERNASIGGWGLPGFSLPLFARFKAKRESSSLTCELLAIGPSVWSSQFQYLWRVEIY